MKILIDAMGGDNAPLEILKGASLASREIDEKICLVGKEDMILTLAKENRIDLIIGKIVTDHSYILY